MEAAVRLVGALRPRRRTGRAALRASDLIVDAARQLVPANRGLGKRAAIPSALYGSSRLQHDAARNRPSPSRIREFPIAASEAL